jgi:uncharacterized damage-inducible protein DinB
MTEHDDLLAALQKQRFFLTNTLRGLTDEQARSRPTVSELSLGGLIKHVGLVERQWVEFVRVGPEAMNVFGNEAGMAEWAAAFTMTGSETVDAVLEAYREVAARTDAFFASVDDLDAAQPLPPAPWFERGAEWSARRVVLHLIGEISQHAGHADILREAIDGAKSMG